MAWSPLPQGLCGASATTAGVDANLVWADGSGFSDFLREGLPLPPRLPVIVRMKAGRTVQDLRTEVLQHGGDVPQAYPGTARHCTAFFTPAYCKAALSTPPALGTMIERFELQLPVVPHRPWPLTPAFTGTSGVRPLTTDQPLIGVIDFGCAFAHWQFRDSTGAGTRLLNLWDQDPDSPLRDGLSPEAFGYGREAGRPSLNRMMQASTSGGSLDEEACYRLSGLLEAAGPFTHGTSVLGLLAGPLTLGARVSGDPERAPSWRPAQDPASRADIVFVQLPRDCNQDSSSAALARHVLDGLRYILSCASPLTPRIVVNLSTGSSRHTHDGSAIIELAMQELLAEDKRLHIVFAAANSYADMRHAELGPMAANARQVLTLNLRPGGDTPSYVVVRFEPGSSFALRLTPPGEQPDPGGFVAVGQAKGLKDGLQHWVAGVVVPQPLPGTAGSALVALAPTQGERHVRSGRWQLEVKALQNIPSPLQFHITLNQVNPGALPRSQQMRFLDVDERFHPQRYLRFDTDDAKTPGTPIKRLGTLNSYATRLEDQRLWVVGSYRLRDGAPSGYSSAGPAAGAAPKRSGPDVSACADESAALHGIRAAGSRSGTAVRVSGTSFAAPQVARALLNTGQLPALQGPAVPNRNGAGNLPA